MHTDSLPRLDANQRRALRAAITAVRGWRDVAGRLGFKRPDGQPIDASLLRADHYLPLCDALGVDWQAAVHGTAPVSQPCAPVPQAAPQPATQEDDRAPAREAAPVSTCEAAQPEPTSDADPVAAAVADVLSGAAVDLHTNVAALARRALDAEAAVASAQDSAKRLIEERDGAREAARNAQAAAVNASRAQASPATPDAATSEAPAVALATMVDPAVPCKEIVGQSSTQHAGRTFARWNDVAAPAVDPAFVWDQNIVADLAVAEARDRNVWLAGMKGTGKSSICEQYAARTGRGYVRIGCHADISADELIGGKGLANGSTFFERGTLVQALQRPGCVILLDEITTVRPAILSMLQGLLDGLGITLPNGSHIRPAAGVRLFVADNTAGAGDSTGQYAGTQIMNSALVDRFAVTITVGYLSPAREALMLSKRTGLAREAATVLVDFANATRQAAEQGVIATPIGPRRLLALAEWIDDGRPVARALDVCLFSRLPEDEREEIRQLANAKIDPDALARLAAGEAAPASDDASTQPANAAAPEFGAAPVDGLGSV